MTHRLLPLLLLTAAAPAFAQVTPAAPEAKPAATPPAAKARLVVGSPAPAFKPEKWFKGEPVTGFEQGKTYVIECWATWCGPCIAAIPHVNELHNKFKDKGLVIIGVNVADKQEAKAAELVKEKGDGMAYRVAYDGAGGNIGRDWLNAAKAPGIPHTFVVRDGKILWMGHPMQLKDDTVAAMIAGTFDPVKFAAEAAAKQAADNKMRDAYLEITKLIDARRFAEAMVFLDTERATIDAMGPAEYDLRRAEIFANSGDATSALAALKAADEKGATNAGVQHRASQLLLNSGVKTDPKIALGHAQKAAELSKRHAAMVMGLAQAHYAAGDKAAALAELEPLLPVLREKSSPMEPALVRAIDIVKSGQPWPADLLVLKATRLKTK